MVQVRLHPLRVGKYLTPQFAAEQISFRVGIIGAAAGRTHLLHSIHTHVVGNTFASCASVDNCRNPVIRWLQPRHSRNALDRTGKQFRTTVFHAPPMLPRTALSSGRCLTIKPM